MIKISNLIILSAGRPHSGDKPALLTKVNGQSLFSWQLNALSSSAVPQVVVGYKAEAFKSLSTQARFVEHHNWQETKSAASLLCADLAGDAVSVSYADILYRPNLLTELQASDSDITLVYDSQWRNRYAGRTQDDLERAEKVRLHQGKLLAAGAQLPAAWAEGEFIGLVHFKGAALEYLRKLQNLPPTELNQLNLSDLLEFLRLEGFAINALDVKGDWAELNAPQDIAHFILGTKAQTLSRLENLVRQSKVLPQVAFTVEDWQTTSSQIVKVIQTKFADTELVVRSSAKSEDAFTHSNAGAYTSILKVVPHQKELSQAIETVIDSYIDCQGDDQVLVQPMLQNVWLSGVAFTRTLEEGSPFYVVNYDESGDTESITSGNSKQHKSLYFRKDAAFNSVKESHLQRLLAALKEVEQILNYDALDIEFAIDAAGQVYLLQARPITASSQYSLDIVEVINLQKAAGEKWQSLQTPAPQVKGDLGLFGVMPDWNPAEIIGTNPGKLASSLYEHLILNDIWATQRAEYGYKDVRPQPLLTHFAGKPYINIRASFNSFMPSNINDQLTEKLVNFYLNYLKKHPYLHDKVEFDVLPTIYGPSFNLWEERLIQEAGLTLNEINQLKEGLLTITQQALSRPVKDMEQTQELEIRHATIISNQNLGKTEQLHLLLENIKTYGTLPFSHLARGGFVAVTLLKEAVEKNWLSSEAYDGFMQSLATVSHELSIAAWQTAQGEKSWESFVASYGHLRPGTYDITSPAYRDDAEGFLRPLLRQAVKPQANTAALKQWNQEKENFFDQLRTIGLQATDAEFEGFLIQAIEGREKSKFIFTKSLSAALSILEGLGKDLDLSTQQLSNLSYYQLLEAFNSSIPTTQLTTLLSQEAKRNEHQRRLSLACQLPPLLSNHEDFSAFILTEDKPNFIGSQRISAPVLVLDSNQEEVPKVEGCIVFIPQADPGYDWLFGQKIAGLITMYGGANSHMAIRCAEFGLPAAVGVGTQLYNQYKKASFLELDPAGEILRFLR